MRRFTLPAVLVTATLFTGCGDQAPTPTESLTASVDVVFSRADPKNAHTHLSGDNEVPARETRAQGQLTLQLSEDREVLSYRLMATNIENVLMAHLHLGAADENGGIVVWLYPSAPPPAPIPGRHTGILAEGEITADSLTGALEDEDLSRLLEEIQAGMIYVNVHTAQFPGGEIRGQVQTGG